MSDFFSNYTKIDYNMNKVKPLSTTRAVNILNRPQIRDKVLANVSTYYPYNVQPNDRPDTISYDYYGSVSYTWIILLANDIVDPYYDWPIFGKNFDNYLTKKYGSIDSARTSIHHYEEVLREETVIYSETEGNKKILEKSIVVDKDTYDNSSRPKRIIYDYDYELIEREKKRNIVLVDNVYVKQIQNEFRLLFR